MKQQVITSTILGVLLLMPVMVSAHEEQVFEINGKAYAFVVGSLGEPLVVDDKSGVDLRVSTVSDKKPVEGLQDALKVELIAGDKKKELSFSTVYGTPGAYKAVFFPTVATTLSYRIFGEINKTPFNVTFTCQPGGHVEASEDTSRVQVSEGVTRTLKTGGFGCPSAKADMGFPEASAELSKLAPTPTRNGMATAAFALAVIALVAAFARRRS